jgi:hypothetical protein
LGDSNDKRSKDKIMDDVEFPESTLDRNGNRIALGDMVRNVAAGFTGELASIVAYADDVELYMRGSHIRWAVKDTQKI